MPSSRTLQCPSCGLQLQAADMNLETMAARCRGCQSLVDLRPEQAAAEPALPVPLPERVTVRDFGGELRIERRWFTWMAVFLAFFCTFWFGVLAFWYVMAFRTGDLRMMLFPLLHVAVGLLVLYWTIAMFVNRTWIVVRSGRLTVRHGPLPWLGNRDVATEALEQLYCEDHIRRSRNGTTVTYSVRARGTDGRLIKLVAGLPHRDQALFIEERIERHLGIVNRRVGSEMRW